MSVVDKLGRKETVAREGADVVAAETDIVWQELLAKVARNPRSLRRHVAKRNHHRLIWKYLAMLSLRESGWSLQEIGRAFGGIHKGHVLRCIENVTQRIRDSLRATFDPDSGGNPESFSEKSCAQPTHPLGAPPAGDPPMATAAEAVTSDD